ncbi:hypothetical protein GEMRC1_009703 [Eukaryota sp. GEM-RC1]
MLIPPSKDNDSIPDVVECTGSCLSKASSDTSSPSSSFLFSHYLHLRLQQSLLALIHLHLLNRYLESALKLNESESRRPFVNLKMELPTFFNKVGYVSHRLFESASLSVKMFVESAMFHVLPEELASFCSFATHFGVVTPSVFLYVYSNFSVTELLGYSHVLSGLELTLEHHNDLEFLNKACKYFPRLKQLHVRVDPSICMALMELMKVNITVTSVNLGYNSIEDEGARALAEVLKINNVVTRVDLENNSIGDVGAIVLAEALKINTTVRSIILTGNGIGNDGVRALAEAFKVNTSVTVVSLAFNSIGDEGACALAEAFKVNASETGLRVFLGWTSIEAEGVKALAEALKVNRKLKIDGVDLLDI